jgi:hypothetical protein
MLLLASAVSRFDAGMKDPFIREKFTKGTIIRETTRQRVFRKIPKGSISDRSRKLARASVQEYRVRHEAVERTAEIMSWSRAFEDPIPLPRGRQFVTLEEAAAYIMKLPKAEQDLEEWQTAVACLIGAAEGRDFLMHARIGMLRALNRNVERAFDQSRKDKHWGKRKLKRDQ